MFRITQGIGDIGRRQAGDGYDIAGDRFRHFMTIQSQIAVNQADLGGLLTTVRFDCHHPLIRSDPPALNPTDRDRADEVIVIQRGHLHAKRRIRINLGGWAMRHDRGQQRCHIAVADGLIGAGVALDGRCVNHRKVQLCIGCAQVVE